MARSDSIITPADEGMTAARREGEIRDDLNPRYIFQMTHISLLCKAIRGEIDLLDLAKKEMDNRGLNEGGAWMGKENRSTLNRKGKKNGRKNDLSTTPQNDGAD